MLAAPDVDVDVFRSQIADMGKSPPGTLRSSCRRDDRALAVSRRVWGDVSRLGSIDPEQPPYKAELAQNEITVIDLTKVKAGDKLHHDKFASSPEIVQLIGARISDGQTLTDSRVGLGDAIITATTGVAAKVGGCCRAGCRGPYGRRRPGHERAILGEHIGSLGPATRRPGAACVEPSAASKTCPEHAQTRYGRQSLKSSTTCHRTSLQQGNKGEISCLDAAF